MSWSIATVGREAANHAARVSTPARTFSSWSIAHFPGKEWSLKTAVYQDNASWKEMETIIRQSKTA